MKKLLCLLLSLILLLSMVACGEDTAKPSSPETTGAAPSGAATEESASSFVSDAGREALDGKKIIFIGNSFTEAANCVISQGYAKLEQKDRVNDQGYFSQLCQNAGLDVDVTAWTFGGHDVSDIFAEVCPANKDCKGKSHPSYLTDRYYDYVAIQCYLERECTGDLETYLKPVMDIFREANPNVKFLLLVPHMAHEKGYTWVDQIPHMQEIGFTIVNWGGMIQDIVTQKTEVPGAKQPYGRPTFVISKDETDGYHQNILAGYLTALMTFCAITGDSAVGQPWEFCYDPSVHPKFYDLETYKSKRYIYEPYTNFDEVFKSEADMRGLQELTDQYIAKFNGGN